MVERMGGPGGTMGSQQYCLKWNNHQNNMLRVFTRLFGQEQFTDVIIAAEGKHIKCHKVKQKKFELNFLTPLFSILDGPLRLQLLFRTPFRQL